jgi:MraZ protein
MTDPTASTSPDGTAYTFHGDYTRAVDAKGRFNLPFRFRQGGSAPGEEKYVVSKGTEGTLAVHPHAMWTATFERMRRGEPGPQLRANLRRMSLGSKTVVPDAQGRIQVPTELLESVGITGKVTVVGMGSYMELWSPDALAAATAGDEGPDDGFMDAFYS